VKKVILKIITITMVLCIFLTINTSFCAADTITYIIADDVTIDESEVAEIEIPVTVSDNQGMMGFMILVSYDDNILSPVSVVRGSALGAGMLNDSIGASQSGQLKIMWTGSENMYANGLIFKLKFKLLNKDFESTQITFDYSKPDTFNEQYEDVTLSFDNCNVYNNSNVLKGDVNGDGMINIIDATEIQKYLASIIEFDNQAKKSADFNGDSFINVVDATGIQKYLVNL